MIVIVCGLPGVGKTTFAKKLAPLINAIILSTDKIRRELIESPTYEKEERKLIYDVMILSAKYLHSSGTNCILDATFNKEDSRTEVKKKLGIQDKQFFVIVKGNKKFKLTFLRKKRKDLDSDNSLPN